MPVFLVTVYQCEIERYTLPEVATLEGPDGCVLCLAVLPDGTLASGAGLRRRKNKGMKSPPNFERLVLGCIEGDFCKYIVNTCKYY